MPRADGQSDDFFLSVCDLKVWREESDAIRDAGWVQKTWRNLKGWVSLAADNFEKSGQHDGECSGVWATEEGRDDWHKFSNGRVAVAYSCLVLSHDQCVGMGKLMPRDFYDCDWGPAGELTKAQGTAMDKHLASVEKQRKKYNNRRRKDREARKRAAQAATDSARRSKQPRQGDGGNTSDDDMSSLGGSSSWGGSTSFEDMMDKHHAAEMEVFQKLASPAPQAKPDLSMSSELLMYAHTHGGGRFKDRAMERIYDVLNISEGVVADCW